MTPENLLSRIGRFEESATNDEPGGVFLVEIDRARQLRDQLGFRLLFTLVRQIRGVLKDGVGARGLGR